MFFGTAINCIAILAGSFIGAKFHSRLPKEIVGICMQAVGLFVLFVGVSMAQSGKDLVLIVMSLVIGAIAGKTIGIEARINSAAEYIGAKANITHEKFTEGAITASLIFCTGSMAVLGSIEDGLGNSPTLLIAKSVIDLVTAAALASTFGMGVALSAVAVGAYQGTITLLASYLQPWLTGAALGDLSGVGGILLIGVGINILEIRKLNVMDMLPSLVVIVILKAVFP